MTEAHVLRVTQIARWVILIPVAIIDIPRAVLNWPNLNPVRLLDSKADALLLLAAVLTQLSALTPRIIQDLWARNSDAQM